VPKKKERINLLYKAEEYWKNFVHLKSCCICGEPADRYAKFKFYCLECYEKLVKRG
jgi:hypothetical protein